MNLQRLTALLGLAQKARKLVSGELAVEQAVRSGKVKLLLIATDASDNAKKGYHDMAAFYGVECHEVLSKTQLGISIGKPHRVALAITDAGFCKSVRELLE